MPYIDQLLEEPEVVALFELLLKHNINLDYMDKLEYIVKIIYFSPYNCPLQCGAICNDFIADVDEILSVDCLDCIYSNWYKEPNKQISITCNLHKPVIWFFDECEKLSKTFEIQQNEQGCFVEYRRLQETILCK